MRSAGILCHISSLASPYGIGTLGKKAYEFVDFLEKAGQKWWQVLPVCPTSYGDSPYQSNSAFAGNPYFIDLDILCEAGLLKKSEINNYFFGDDPEKVDYKLMFDYRYPLLRKAYARFEKSQEYFDFCDRNRFWLDDYALFMAIKEHNHYCCWLDWDADVRFCREDALNFYRDRLSRNIEFYYFLQFEFYRQWADLKRYANERGIGIIGDMPIYVALDSAEVWKSPWLFELDENKLPRRVAGCPPDAFSDKGQLWGNPLYNWDLMREQGYDWWIKRLRLSFELFDRVRIDHFRGFEAYYAIEYGRDDARVGVWEKGPGMALFDAVRARLGNVGIIAEDLGFLTDDVHALLANTGYPGMKVLQFAFNPYEDNMYLPHNYPRNCVAYTGTHDNDTFLGWFSAVKGEEKNFAADYLGIKRKAAAPAAAIRALMASPADTVIIPFQDYLGKGSESRMNTPSTTGGNWLYRMLPDEPDGALMREIRELTNTFRRI